MSSQTWLHDLSPHCVLPPSSYHLRSCDKLSHHAVDQQMAISQPEATTQLLNQHLLHQHQRSHDWLQTGPARSSPKSNLPENIRSPNPAQNRQPEPLVAVHPMIRPGMIDYLPSFQTCDVPDPFSSVPMISSSRCFSGVPSGGEARQKEFCDSLQTDLIAASGKKRSHSDTFRSFR